MASNDICPRCGSADLQKWEHQELDGRQTVKYWCRDCQTIEPRSAIVEYRAKCDALGGIVNHDRITLAVLHLRKIYKRAVTRLEIARFLGVAKSPHFLSKLETAVEKGGIKRYRDRHPLTGRDCFYYTRPTNGGNEGE